MKWRKAGSNGSSAWETCPTFPTFKNRVSLLFSHLLSPWHTLWGAAGDFQSIVPPRQPAVPAVPQCSRGKFRNAPRHQASRGVSREVLTLPSAKQNPTHKPHPHQLSACAHLVMGGHSDLGAGELLGDWRRRRTWEFC